MPVNQAGRAMGPGPPLAEVVPIGGVRRAARAVAAANLRAVMGLEAMVARPAAAPDAAYLAGRGQYDAEALLSFLSKSENGAALRVGVIEEDLCLPILAYVYGEAYVGGGVAVVSLFRLAGEAGVGSGQELARLAKVICHETAHALGLAHCGHPRCLMHFAGGLADLDAMALGFCPACRAELARRRSALIKRLR